MQDHPNRIMSWVHEDEHGRVGLGHPLMIISDCQCRQGTSDASFSSMVSD